MQRGKWGPRVGVMGWALLALAAAGCSSVSDVVSTGARSALVVLVRDEVTTATSAPLPMPPRDELKAFLSRHFLWLADDKRAAQWIAYVDVRTPPNPLQPFGLTLRELKKNPDWRPLEVSDPIQRRGNEQHESFRLLDQSEAAERGRASSTR